MKILLTGATGFLGSHVLRALVHSGHDAVILLRPTSRLDRISDLDGTYHAINADALEEFFLETCPDAIIHCATEYGRKQGDTVKVMNTNLLFSLQLLELSITYGCPYFVNTGSFFCKQLPDRLDKGEPLYMPDYTLSKYQFSQWGKQRANEGKITFIDFCMEHLYGPDDGEGKFIPWLEAQLKENTPSVMLTSGIQKRDFVPVTAAADAYVRLLGDLEKYRGYQHFEVGTGRSMTLRTFVEQMKADMHSTTELAFGEIPTKAEEIMYSVADNNSPYLVMHE